MYLRCILIFKFTTFVLVPAIRKLYTPCDTTIQFDMTAQHEQDENLMQNLTVIVHFISSQIQLRIE